jgi:uncharacterized membrane protein
VIEHHDESARPVSVTGRGAHAGPGGRLSGSRRKTVLTVHLIGALGLLGASTVLLVGGLHAATRDDPQDAHSIYALLRLLTFTVDIPLAIVTLLAGLVLVFTSTWRIFGDRWLTAKLALYLVTATLGVALLGPSIDTMLDVTETSRPGERSTRWRPIFLPAMQTIMLLAAATLAVFKPGRRAREPLARPPASENAGGSDAPFASSGGSLGDRAGRARQRAHGERRTP